MHHLLSLLQTLVEDEDWTDVSLLYHIGCSQGMRELVTFQSLWVTNEKSSAKGKQCRENNQQQDTSTDHVNSMPRHCLLQPTQQGN